MPDGIIIIRNPRRVVLDALAAVPTSDIAEEDLDQFTECLAKGEDSQRGWTKGEARFMQKHLPPSQRRDDWYE